MLVIPERRDFDGNTSSSRSSQADDGWKSVRGCQSTTWKSSSFLMYKTEHVTRHTMLPCQAGEVAETAPTNPLGSFVTA